MQDVDALPDLASKLLPKQHRDIGFVILCVANLAAKALFDQKLEIGLVIDSEDLG